MSKYTIYYCSGSTGYGWEHDTDSIEEVESAVNELGSEYTAMLHVWDDGIKEFIFWKDVLTYKARKDMINSSDRDFRTTTRKRKDI